MSEAPREPVFNVPAVVAALAILLVAIHAGRWLAGDVLDERLLGLFAFNPARFGPGGAGIPGLPWAGEPWAGPLSFFSHALLHGDLMHLVVNTAWLLAVGTPMARRMTPTGFLAYFFLCAAGGALFFLLVHSGLDAGLVGASGGISGLMAGVFRLLYAAEGAQGRYNLREHPSRAARLSVRSMLTRREPLTAIIGWVVLNVVVAVAMRLVGDGAAIAWEAHLGGFFVGLLTLELFDRGHPREMAAGETVA